MIWITLAAFVVGLIGGFYGGIRLMCYWINAALRGGRGDSFDSLRQHLEQFGYKKR